MSSTPWEQQMVGFIESVPGLRYHPTNEELMIALKSMILGTYDLEHGVISLFDVCEHDPWDLALRIDEMSKFRSSNRERFCFHRQRNRYKNGMRSNRAAGSGYWKSTGKKRDVVSDDDVLMGFKQTLVFRRRHASKGERTTWVMHEYHLDPNFLGDNSLQGSMPFVVCRIKCKKEKMDTKASSVHKAHETPLPTIPENEVEEHPASSPATPAAPATQVTCDTRSADSSDDEEWTFQSLEKFLMSPSYEDIPLQDNSDELFLQWMNSGIEMQINSQRGRIPMFPSTSVAED